MTILDRPPAGWKRPTMSAVAKLQSVLNQRGQCAETGVRLEQVKDCRFDHRPALWERKFDTETGDTIPPANDPAFIDVVSIKGHDIRTHGPGGERRITTAGSDSGRRSKGERLEAEHNAFRRRVLAPVEREEGERLPDKRRHRWPKRSIQTKPMGKKGKRA